ncbi:MAG: hypothetical protein VR72_10210 [Clostridiaceae bacterium BRH_c20a]|nr:MAG: hypothetical protein VR72_10210 [Clostridiaceae bacterium BRH_c20a]
MIIVSACLAGVNCRYDGKSKKNSQVIELIVKGEAIPLCPEQLGGLSTPRDPVNIQSGINVLVGTERVLTLEGEDVSRNFIQGAYEVLKIAELIKPSLIILKSKSPSCGNTGVTFELLRQKGLRVLSELEWEGKNERPED